MSTKKRRIVVIGAGPGGICTGIKLKEAGYEDFVILEKAGGVGGTWYHNRYPGAACDVPSHVYSFSFEPNPDWSRVFAESSEIQAYLLGLVEKWGLRSYLKLDTEIVDARYDEAQGRWMLTSGDDETFTARVVLAGVGGLVPARELLRTGGIVAIKGLGGFHLAVDATDDAAVTRLRTRKHRPDKPLAVMVPDLDAARRLVHLDPAEARLLSSPARPVLLARRRADARLAPSVAPDNPMLGVMLAYTPVHHLLLAELDIPLVMTSANVSGEPIVFRDADIDTQVGPVADALLTNDRPIVAPCDDSVVRMAGQHLLPVRRARGYAPVPVAFEGGRRAALAVGGELKNTFCLTDGDHAWVSPHIGDMGALATLRTFEQTVARFQTMCGVEPQVIATDAHPGYVTSRWARRAGPAEAIHEVQHHHAHVAAVMAEHRLPPATPVLGFAFDGTGYGHDGTIWGGEVLRATAHAADRLAHLVPVPLPGGDAAIEHPARIALAHLRAAGVTVDETIPAVAAIPPDQRRLLDRQFTSGFGCVPTTSMGRLFDAVASIVGLRHAISYEAQAAIDLEHAARDNREAAAAYAFDLDGPHLDQRPVVAAIAADVRAGRSVAAIADGFHTAVAHAVCGLADRHATDGQVVVLSGGVFQNALLTERTVARLRDRGHDVRTHRLVPPNDGGLALGQAFIATHANAAEEH